MPAPVDLTILSWKFGTSKGCQFGAWRQTGSPFPFPEKPQDLFTNQG
jgi:hypothetical protein